MVKGNLLEIFSSYQGEGIYAGAKQVFIRLGGCCWRCAYCDTPESWTVSKKYRVETFPGSAQFKDGENPVTIEFVCEIIKSYIDASNDYHSVSITGGEPLLQAEFLSGLIPAIKKEFNLKIYLETSGTLHDRLEKIAGMIDIAAMDIKPPSCPGAKTDWEDIAKCLELVHDKQAFVKIVVMKNSPTLQEVERSAQIIAKINKSIPLILMPVTPVNEESVPPDFETLENYRRTALKSGIDVHIIPQIHKMAGWL